jgi:hypothetical protein
MEQATLQTIRVPLSVTQHAARGSAAGVEVGPQRQCECHLRCSQRRGPGARRADRLWLECAHQLSQAPTVVPTQPPVALWLPEYLPQALRNDIEIPPQIVTTSDKDAAAIKLEVISGAAENPAVVPWVYALAAPFPTITDAVSLESLQALWKGEPAFGIPAAVLLVDPSTRAVFEVLWGQPSTTVSVRSTAEILAAAWEEKNAWAILPFEQLEPRWKVIAVDGQSPVQKKFDPIRYGLTVLFGLQGDVEQITAAQIQLPMGNRRSERMTTVALTGVTALVRGTASLMTVLGMTYPATDIGPWLREADILHINNEVPFAKDCPPPHNWEGLVFCSQTRTIELLEDVGTDVVELTGDHLHDWGPEAMFYTLDLYQERGWKTYGGGKNAEEARQPALFEHNGNKIAFIGCNAKPPGYALASDTSPGAIHCDFDYMESAVKKLREEGYLPIVTFQHLEFYTYEPRPALVTDFHRMAKAGGVIISGSQAHHPHAFAFEQDAFLHYGLGNLFFDQTNQGDAPRTAFIDRHVFYNGRHISTELLTIYLVDYARSRPMNEQERQDMLQKVFDASTLLESGGSSQ